MADATTSLVPRILFRDESLCLASWRTLFFEVWSNPGTAEHMRKLREHQIDFIGSLGGQKMGMVAVIRMAKMVAPTPEFRAELTERSRVVRPHSYASLLVIERGGLLKALVRSILAGLIYVSPSHEMAVKVLSSVKEGFDWLAPLTQTTRSPATAAEIEAMYTKFIEPAANVGPAPSAQPMPLS
jgi:hypothetical protein